uniref:phage tail protein n=1 Tax=Lactiplantibacillus paraplantarum TaxID=60520 RepID=UPI001ED9974D
MIKFYDSGGTVHFGQATITRKTSVNGGLSLTGEVFAGDDVLNGLDYGWWLNFDNEKYVITYKKLSDDTNTIVFDAVQQFFWDFAKVVLHSQYTGSHEYSFYLGQLFDKSGYTYKNDVAVPAFEKENWGYKNKLDLFNDIIDQADVEFEVHNETVHIAKQIGSDLTSFVRKGINLSDLTEEMKISDFATYARGYGAFKDDQDQSKGRLEVEYRSELAKQFGDLEMDPIVDKRYTIADNLIAALKKRVDATYTVSMTMNIYDLENAGYPNYEAPKVGDWILAIDEALNFKRKIRIIQLEEQFDVTGKHIGYTATCGDLNIVDQYTHLQISLDNKVQQIQEAVDAAAISANGKNTNYYGAKEPVSANEGDLWFDQSNSDPDKWSIKQWVNGRWEQITLNPGEVDAKVNVAKQEAETAVENAKSASDKTDQLAAKYDDTNSLASQAMGKAVSAQGDASSAVATANSTAAEFGKVDQKADNAVASALNAQSGASDAVSAANSTASDFGKVSQKTDSAVATAMNAQSNASDAVKQASSAAADSKDAKQIAGAVSQSYKTLTDGSTMTIAELESGLAVKLTKTDLDGYATQTWTQNQVKMTADGINGTMSSIKSTVDSQTTSINDLKADSSSFKSQFTTVNNTLGKQTTDIGTLQASSKELTSGFNTLTSDNATNKNDISQLKQTATEVSSTLETVQTQVQNSAVGTNLIQMSNTIAGYVNANDGTISPVD